ncbi:MAG: hypothetical protein GX803_01475 [Lentisphaerae bacterium]|jgi:hypothetical protein|nr:hypothetical protein [Lentisphaerota bacterium]
MTAVSYSFGEYRVSLALAAEDSLGPLEDLHICHLGMRFISPRQIKLFSMYEFDIAMRPVGSEEEPSKIRCCGVVVGCDPENGGYRIVIHFADLEKSDACCLENLTRVHRMRCDYCANFD